MSGVFGGSSGKNDPQNVNIPAFTSSGGITPQQQDLASFSLGQDLTAQGALFGGSGTGMSTMATQGAEGAQNNTAQQVGGMSDADQDAMYQLYQNQVQGEEQSLQNQITLDNQNNSGPSLASLAGTLFGSGTKSSLATS